VHPKPQTIPCIPLHTRFWHPGTLGTLGVTYVKSRLIYGSSGRWGTRQVETHKILIKTDKTKSFEDPEDWSPDRIKMKDGDMPGNHGRPRGGSKPRP